MTWQADFDRWFPYGANVTIFRSDPEEPEATQFICPRIMVEAEEPLVLKIASEVKASLVEVDRVEDYDEWNARFTDKLVWDSRWPDEWGYRITDRLSEAARVYAAQTRQSQPWVYGDES